MYRRLTLLLLLVAGVAAGCSRNPERPSAGLPTAPSALAGSLLGSTPVAPGGVSGPMDVLFPGRNEVFDFFTALNTKYQTGLGRGPSTSFVDREGEVVWIQEYIRYRVNGCDHATATLRVLAQIDGGTPGGVCGSEPTGEIAFPSRADVFDFRRQLEVKYQALGRGLNSSFVDIEGAVVWIQEYLRYRLNGCSHAIALEKVFSQIDGRGIAPTCFVAPVCNYRLTPGSQNFGGSGGTFEFELFSIGGTACTWTVTSDSSFVTITAPTTGQGNTRVRYTVAANQSSSGRSAKIRLEWSGGSTEHLIFQAGSELNVQVTLVDSFRSGSAPTTSCFIQSTATPCTFTASATAAGNVTYNWRVEYLYPNLVTHTALSASNTFTFTQTCGGSTSTAQGFETPMTLTLIVTDTTNNISQTVVIEYVIKLFTC
jgi:hypothetical protein